MITRRVLTILPSYVVGCAERYSLRLIDHAKTHGLEWHVTSVLSEHRALEDEFREAGTSVHQAPGYARPTKERRQVHIARQHDSHAVKSIDGIFAGLVLTLARSAGAPWRAPPFRRSTPPVDSVGNVGQARRLIYATTGFRRGMGASMKIGAA